MEMDYLKYINKLPVIPEVASKVMNLAEEGLDISFKELENIIKVDPGLTAKVLKVANSALYARQKEIKNLQTAITLLGFKNIKSLILLVTASAFFKKDRKSEFYQNFWKHSIFTAFMAKSIATKCKKIDIAETVFICGLLHNVGQAVLFIADPEKYKQVLEMEKTKSTWVEGFEQKLFGVDHKVIGSELFKRWNFPDMFIDVAAEHDSLSITSSYKIVIIYITIAGLIADKMGYGAFYTKKQELCDKLIYYTSLNEQDIKNYEKNFISIIKQDPLFVECQDLFGIIEEQQQNTECF